MFFDIKNANFLNTQGVNYCCIVLGIRKTETIFVLKNLDLNEKSGVLQDMKDFFVIVKIKNKNTSYKRNKEKLKGYALNCYCLKNGKAKLNILKNKEML